MLEAPAIELAAIDAERGKAGLVVVKRRVGRPTPWLVVLTEGTWQALQGVYRDLTQHAWGCQAAGVDAVPRR